MAGGVASSVSAVGRGRTVDLGDGYQIREITPSGHLLQRSLRELAVRERTEVHVLMVRHGTGSKKSRSVHLPSADYVLQEGDNLVVAGSREALARFESLR